MKSKTIFLCAGGTGGHVFPALAVAQQLKKNGYTPIVLTDARSISYLSNQNIEYKILPIVKPSGGILNKVLYLLSLGYSTLVSVKHILIKKPSVVIGFGGYPSFPAMCAGIILRKKIIIHEQNSILGKANQLLANFANKIATSFSEISNLPEKLKSKIILTGNPVRQEIINVSNIPYPDITDDFKLHILVTGGSQGSKIFSKIIPDALRLIPENYKNRIRIDQQARGEEIETVKQIYQQIGVDSEVKTFFVDIPNRLASSHLCICRSGASTLAELAASGRPAIFVPLPYAKLNHQQINAQYFENNNAAKVILEKDFSAEKLSEVIIDYFANPKILLQQSQNAKKLSIENSAQKIVDII